MRLGIGTCSLFSSFLDEPGDGIQLVISNVNSAHHVDDINSLRVQDVKRVTQAKTATFVLEACEG